MEGHIDRAALGSKLKAARKRAGVTQYELADYLGISQASISQWERGYSMPEISTAKILADYLKMSLDDLYDRSVDEPKSQPLSTGADSKTDPSEALLLAKFRKMNDAGKMLMNQQADLIIASGLYDAV